MEIDSHLIDRIVSKTKDELVEKYCIPALITFEELYKFLASSETRFVEALLRVNPIEYGVTEPYLGMEDIPRDVIAVENQKITYDGKTVLLDTQYVPRIVHQAYEELCKAYENNSSKKILIHSGYRSPANQAANFIKWLQYYEYDFKKTLGFVSIPGYSQHSLATHTALDFQTEEGIGIFDSPPFGRFDQTQEYSWLLENASEYGFILTCPENNDLGVNFEPWHWQFVG